MLVKELKKIIDNVPEAAVVVVSNPKWQTSELTGSQYVDKERSWRDTEYGTLYLDIKNFKR